MALNAYIYNARSTPDRTPDPYASRHLPDDGPFDINFHATSHVQNRQANWGGRRGRDTANPSDPHY